MEHMAHSEKKTRKSPVRGEKVDPRITSWVSETVESIGLNKASEQLNDCIRNQCKSNPDGVYARGQIKVLLDDPSHRFQPYWHTYFGVWSGALGNVVDVPQMEPMAATEGNREPEVLDAEFEPTVEPQPNKETAIVRVVDGIAWTLPTADLAGAEQARIPLTELATKLGYSDKAQLKLLASRHAQEIAEFGETFTVKVSVKQGFTNRIVNEPTYNPDQAAYLALSSETPQGRSCRVRIIKAYKSLLAMFARTVAAQDNGADVAMRVFDRFERMLEKRDELYLGTFRELIAGKAAAHPVNPVPRGDAHETPDGRVSAKRQKLQDLVVDAACAPKNASGDEKIALYKAKWRELHSELQKQKINAQHGMVQCAAAGEPCKNKSDWLERHGHLDEAIATAKRLWGTVLP